MAWTPLSVLSERFNANVAALAMREPLLAEQLRTLTPERNHLIQAEGDRLCLGVSSGESVQPLPHPLPPTTTRELTAKLFPSGACNQPVLIAGEDLGWLWNAVYQLPCAPAAGAPGHRSPIFCLIKDVERLWVILHIQDWRELLADTRVRLFVGNDAFERFRHSLVDEPMCPCPSLSVTVDPTLWPAGMTIDAVLAGARVGRSERLAQLNRRLDLAYGNVTPQQLAAKYQSSQPIKVLGITSRYTTFLQYSMRDWLAAFERLGHRTQLLIESADHEVPNNLAVAAACAVFEPDLVVIIDHYRAEIEGIPANVPVVMWVQDALPNLFTPRAGAAQGPLDYALGFARLRMLNEFRYPEARYMPAIVGVNDRRFEPGSACGEDLQRFSCDVSFVSHASAPADVLLKREIDRIGSPEAARLLGAIYERLRSIYADGGIVCEPIVIQRIAEQAMRDTHTTISQDQIPALLELFTQRINNALFRHQTLLWLAEMDVDLQLYGRGWEEHPSLRRFARGVADNQSALSSIYQASRINLHISPHGAVHQRVLEGLAAGGFFLLRGCPGDVLEREFENIWDRCRSEGITSDEQLLKNATPQIVERIKRVSEMLQLDPFAGEFPFIEVLRSSEACGYIRSAGTVWGADYDAVSFNSVEELRTKVTHFLSHAGERRALASSMRKPVLERFTYLATTRRLMSFMANDLQTHATPRQAVAA
jgi:hypothetical protein